MGDSAMKLPKYTTPREVRAAKITQVTTHESDNGSWLVFGDLCDGTTEGFRGEWVTRQWAGIHDPKPGDYFVMDDDQTSLCLPAEVFEARYTASMGSEVER